MKKLFLLTALVGVAFASCKRNENPRPQGTEVTFTSDINQKQIGTRVANDQWETNDRIGIFMNPAGKGIDEAIYYNVDAAVAADGTVTPSEEMRYPERGNVDFMAFYPWCFDNEIVDLSNGPTIKLNVETDGSKLPNEVLFSTNAKGKAASTNAVELDFEYIYSKIVMTVVATPESELTAADFAEITVDLEGLPTEGNMVIDGANTGNIYYTNIASNTMVKTGSTATSASFEALVLPTENREPTTFVFNFDGREFTQTFNDEYLKGMQYEVNYTLDVTPAGELVFVTAGASITPRDEVTREHTYSDEPPVIEPLVFEYAAGSVLGNTTLPSYEQAYLFQIIFDNLDETISGNQTTLLLTMDPALLEAGGEYVDFAGTYPLADMDALAPGVIINGSVTFGTYRSSIIDAADGYIVAQFSPVSGEVVITGTPDNYTITMDMTVEDAAQNTTQFQATYTGALEVRNPIAPMSDFTEDTDFGTVAISGGTYYANAFGDGSMDAYVFTAMSDGVTIDPVTDMILGNGWFMGLQPHAALNTGATIPSGTYTIGGNDIGVILQGQDQAGNLVGFWLSQYENDDAIAVGPIVSGEVVISNDGVDYTMVVDCVDDAGNAITGTIVGAMSSIAAPPAGRRAPAAPSFGLRKAPAYNAYSIELAREGAMSFQRAK
ncbi:MAG: fimbrillin family protein [Alistipes sp.]|jgi:hypothetical protein|nr:fimbrillin family protein [Alistipes sp.]